MCGIAGAFRSEGGLGHQMMTAMATALSHRGPDDAGTWVSDDGRIGFGHRRLAIIDLTDAAHQPMSSEDGSIQLVFNGEIYNFPEIKRCLEQRGHRFRSNSDTETIIHAYEEWGVSCFERFRGMLAIGLWDANCRKLLLARDHVGIKPLFYYWDGRTFAFASEIKAFWAIDGLDRTQDRSAIFDYLTYLYIPAPKTGYARIRKLLAGHFLRFDGQDIEIKQYWDVSLEPDDSLDEGRAVELVGERLTEAVRLSTVSDVPVGVFLSGGLDSSTVVAEMAAVTRTPIDTFSIGFDLAAHSETVYARQVAEHFGTRHHERLVGRESVARLLEKLVGLYDEPYCDGSAIPTFCVSELAREHVKVALSGDGGDEVFAGYNWYEDWFQQDELNRLVPTPVKALVSSGLGRAWPRQSRGAGLKQYFEAFGDGPLELYGRQMELFGPKEKRQVLGVGWDEEFADYDDYWYFRQYWRADVDPITRLQYLDLKTYLPDDILTKVDRASMAVALEVRPPLLDPRLIETAFRVPGAIRFRGREKKRLLKQAMKNILPAVILDREKKGFSSPLLHWMAEERPWVEARLQGSRRIVRDRVLDRLGRLRWGAKCWALLILEQWAETEHAAKPSDARVCAR